MALRFSPARGSAAFSLSSAVRGPAGAAATIAVGTTNTLAAGTSATVTNSGSSSAATFNFSVPRGTDSGLRYAFETSTTMAAPASGGIRFNNATLASATAIAINATNSDGTDTSDWVITWDDSTSTPKGTLRVRKEGAGATAYIYTITSVTDNTTWLQLAVTYVSGSGTLSVTDPVYLIPNITGNAGTIIGSTGATDNRVLRSDGTGGITAQSSAVSIDDTGNITPSANDAAALGAAATSWSDLFLASGAVINYNNGTYTVTQSGSGLTLSGTLSLGTSNAFTCGSIELGAASDTTVSRASAGVIAVEGVSLYPSIPINSQSAAYPIVLADANTAIYHPSSDNNARTFTIPANGSVAFPVGTCLTFINEINTVTIAITTDTLTLAGAGSTGSRSLAANGIATAIKVASTKWVISGTGLS